MKKKGVKSVISKSASKIYDTITYYCILKPRKLYLKVSSIKYIHVPCMYNCTYKSNFFLTMPC